MKELEHSYPFFREGYGSGPGNKQHNRSYAVDVRDCDISITLNCGPSSRRILISHSFLSPSQGNVGENIPFSSSAHLNPKTDGGHSGTGTHSLRVFIGVRHCLSTLPSAKWT